MVLKQHAGTGVAVTLLLTLWLYNACHVDTKVVSPAHLQVLAIAEVAACVSLQACKQEHRALTNSSTNDSQMDINVAQDAAHGHKQQSGSTESVKNSSSTHKQENLQPHLAGSTGVDQISNGTHLKADSQTNLAERTKVDQNSSSMHLEDKLQMRPVKQEKPSFKALHLEWNESLAHEDPASLNLPGNTTSYYLPWIQQDLEPWAKLGGITRDDVGRASQVVWSYCAGDVLRFQILDGRLWVDFKTFRSPQGWYPAMLGPGNASAKGHVPYIIFALLDVLRAFPGQIPDVDAVMHTADFPCIKKHADVEDYPRPHEPEDTGRPILMLGYNSGDDYLDIPFPDFTAYGHEHSFLTAPGGGYLLGWDKQRSLLEAKFAAVPFETRLPQVMWRGRTSDDDAYPFRDAMRREFVACPAKLVSQGRPEDAALFNVTEPFVPLSDVGFYRYQMYLESKAYVSNLKQKMATGSPVLTPRMEYYEWWARALQKGEHYIEVASGEAICDDVAAKVKQMNELVDGQAPSEPQPKAKAHRRFWRRLMQSSADVPQQPNSAVAGAAQAGATVKGKAPAAAMLDPKTIGSAGKKFVDDHVRLDDVRMYIKDLLREYARHQSFRPWRSEGSRCYNWQRMLEEFAVPHAKDVEELLAAYPYLNTADDYGCADEDQVPYFWLCETMEQYPGRPEVAAEGCGLEMPPHEVMAAYRSAKQQQ